MQLTEADRDKVAIQAAEALKRSQYGATAIKVELEGRLNRRDRNYNGREYCDTCHGDGNVECTTCDAEGRTFCTDDDCVDYIDSEGHCSDDTCESCDDCDGNGTISCTAEDCDDGYKPRSDAVDDRDWGDLTVCQDFILEHLSQYGLAEEYDSDNETHEINGNSRVGDLGDWVPVGALRYCMLYNDPSVDTECTMTLLLDRSENILLLPKLVEAFIALGEAVGNGVNIDNAGMHMSLINDPEGTYDEYASRPPRDNVRFQNFRRSMSLLMPALFFLGASCENTRSLHFRQPMVAVDEKYSAVFWVGTTLEFRVFDPCYERPEQILDNFVVMKNCMRYWSDSFISPRLDKITTGTKFGVDGNDRTDRFYSTVQHVDLLNAGLKKLKPSYKTIKQLKLERKFDTSKRKLNAEVNKLKKAAVTEYKEYVSREQWLHEIQIVRYTEHFMSRVHPADEKARKEAIKEAEKQAKEVVKQERGKVQTLEQYTTSKVEGITNRSRGNYTLTA